MQQQPPSDGGGGTATELRSDAKELGNSAANRIHSEVDARKDTAVDQAKSMSSAIKRVAGEMDQSAPDWLKSALQQGAQKIQQFADTIEHKDSRELMREAQGFARSNPGTFLAACAAAGFAAARILKAGGEAPGSPGRAANEQATAFMEQDSPIASSAQQQPAFRERTPGEFA